MPTGGAPAPGWTRALAAVAVVAGVIGAAIALTPGRIPEPPAAVTAWSIVGDDAAPSASEAATAPPPEDAGAPRDAEAPEGSVSDAGVPTAYIELDGGTLAEKNDVLMLNMQHALGLTDAQVAAVRAVFAGSEYIGQGNPRVSRHPLSRADCLERRAKAAHLPPADVRCGAPNMVPLYDPTRGETPERAKVCIDQFEFPNIECEFPVVWVRANEAQSLCHALGKRLCDAHEWEGACAGALKDADSEYAWGERRIMMQYLHNQHREMVWSYGKEKNHALCATGSKKGPKCITPSWNGCGTNDYPAGSFPECVSPLGAFDLNGNAAEHMNFPRKPEQLGSHGGSGETEMKGSWFIFEREEAHEDDCRWRAPDWHVTPIDDTNSHRNYHLGFRCCRDLEASSAADGGTATNEDAGSPGNLDAAVP
jgi:sulfatase modifying factor 1